MASPRYQLYLIRHAIAEERGDAWPDDAKRPLSEGGMKRMRKSARGLAEAGVSFDVILSSPLVRARQTAEIVAAAMVPRPAVVIIESLSPGSGPAAVLNDLQKQERRTR